MTEERKFSVMVSLFEWIQKSKYTAKKRSKFRKFLDTFCNPHDHFSAIRLLLPSLDRERGSYGLKESVLATSLVDALGMSRDSPDALRLFNWRKGGAKTGANAGNFALVAHEVLQRRQGMASGGLTIKEVNELLDRLASSENRAEKTSVLSTLINRTNAQEMKWIVMIILKDLKLGISEKSIFHEFHPDAEDLFNVTCDLKLVCEKLRDPTQRHKRQDIEVGKAVRPQLAKRERDAHAAWKKLHGKEVVVECKFDGDRIQIHKNGSEVHYFSRSFIDHTEYGHGMSDLIIQNILADRCILDGEMLVWDTSLNRFADFGSNQEIAKAAKEGLDRDRQLCYVVFDILYVGDTSIIHQSLKERHELLQKVVKPLKGRLEILVPNGGLNAHRLPGEPCCSLVAYTVDDVERFFKETVDNRDEGVVLKDLNSKWEPGDRSGKWIKLKPDYVRAGSDLDVLIIGGYYGTGRHGGEVAQFLVGLAERPTPDTYPRRFISFCRVGNGLSDDELDAVVTKLKPYFRRYEYLKKAPPSFYQVTNNAKERPDVWIESPEKSIIISISSDIRTIRSEVFAAPYSLRFPRIERVRYDKPWHECLDVQSFVELVQACNGTTQKEQEYGGLPDRKPTRLKSSSRGERRNVSLVPSHFVQTDVSRIKGETLIFSNMMFYFVNLPPTYSLESFHKMVAENGGTFSMNLNNSVTHCVAAESKGIKYQAAKLHGDVIHYSWVLDCCLQKKLLPLQPKYFLFLSGSSKKKLREEIDEFSDSFYWDLDLADIKQLLSNINVSEDTKALDYFWRKFCPEDKWSYFHGCSVFFYTSSESITPDWESLLELQLRRLKLEIIVGGGKVTNSLVHATHLVVLVSPGADVNFDSLMKRLTGAEKQVLCNKKFHVVGSQWLEDAVKREQKLQENVYSLKPCGLEDVSIEECKDGVVLDYASSNLNGLRSQSSSFPQSGLEGRGGKAHLEPSGTLVKQSNSNIRKKRGRPTSESVKKAKVGSSQACRKRVRVGKGPSKICDDESNENCSFEEEKNEGIEISEGNDNIHKTFSKEKLKSQEAETVEDLESLLRGKTAQKEFAERDRQEEWFNEASDVGRGGTDNRREEFFREVADIDGRQKHHGQEQENEKHNKLEVMDDPVQAMLMDMIPSLGTKKVEFTTSSVSGDDRPVADRDVQAVEKKKVSYKNLASELLKNW